MNEFYHVYQLSLWTTSIEHATPDCVCTGKQCSQCTYTICLGNFHRFVRSKDGYRAECKICRKAESETEEFKAKRRERDKKNAEHINEKKRAWYHSHPEQVKIMQHKSNNSEAGRAKYKRYVQRHPERRRISENTWKKKNVERVKVYAQTRTANRKARKRQAGGSFTTRQWEALKAEYNHTCLCCRRREPVIKLTPDHIVPIAKGGSSDIGNIQPLCLPCNMRKKTKVIDYRPLWKNEDLSG